MKHLTIIILWLVLLLASPVMMQETINPVKPPLEPAAKPTTAPQGEVSNPSTANEIPSQTIRDKTEADVSSPVPVAGEGNFELVDAATRRAATVVVPRAAIPPVIDGRLDDEIWKTAVPLTNFFQTNPGDNTAPSKPTVAYFAYDAKHFYIAVKAFDDPRQIRATVARRDNVFGEDNIRIYLDTFNDGRRAYLLGFNPLGIQADAIYTEGRGSDFSVDIVMQSKGVVDEQGYTIEVAVPFKSLRYEAGKDKFWRFHVQRNIDRFNDELDSYMPISREIAGLLNQAGRLTGLENIDTERNLEIIPSLTLSETGRRVRSLPRCVGANCFYDEGRFVNAPLQFDPGLTAKFGITPTVTLDVAVNPDFAQVEADATVVLANQRFPIFFPERRPFFLEGIDIFQTRMNVINTRAIVDPDYAVKLTGKRGRTVFGLLAASDNAPGNFNSDDRLETRNFRLLDANAYSGIVRLKRDIGAQDSSLGMFATSYNLVGRHNHLGGFDGRIRLTNQTIAEFQVTGTTTRRSFVNPDANGQLTKTGTNQNGFGYNYLLDKTGRNFGYTINGVGRTQGFRADLGFAPRTNTNQHRAAVRFSDDPNAKRFIIARRLTAEAITSHDFQGRAQNHQANTELTLTAQRNTAFGFGFEINYERLFDFEFGGAGSFTGSPERKTWTSFPFAFISTAPSQKWSASLVVVPRFNAFDFDFGAGRRFPRVSPAALTNQDARLDPGKGNGLLIEADVRYAPIPAFSVSLDYTKSSLRRKDTGLTAFDDNVFSLRSTYQFTPFTFVRARIDYSTLSTLVRSQFLFGYTPNPGTAFFAGYNDDTNRNGFSPFTSQAFIEPGFRRNRREFFIKASYLFRRSIG